MRYWIHAIFVLGTVLLLTNCTQRPPEIVTVVVIQTRVVEDLPALDGTPSDLLTNSRWQLDRYVIDGIESREYVNGQWVQFEELTWFGFDACNDISGGYRINQDGDFILNIRSSTLVECVKIQLESGEELSIGDSEFTDALESAEELSIGDSEFIDALESVVAFQIQGEHLWLFYSDDNKHSLVFSPEIVPKD